MKKRIWLVTAVMAICIFALGMIGASAATYGDLTYEVVDGEVMITDCAKTATVVEVPETIDGCTVTMIENGAFSRCENLTSITLPVGLTQDGGGFYGCISLISITVDENNKKYSSLNGVLFSKEKKTIVAYPAGKTDTSYIIPDSVTRIEDGAFSYCHNLTSITIPDNVTCIEENAFVDCDSLISITIPNGVIYIGGTVFSGCTSLTSINIPDSVTEIKARTFDNCRSLTSITIPDGVTNIESDAFAYCTSLTNINVGENNQEYSSLNGVLFDKQQRTICVYPAGKTDTSYIIPDSVTSVGNNAFVNCINLTSITLPEGVKSIDACAFYDCSSLTNILIPDSVTSIGNFAFFKCTNLTSITLPEGVKSIGGGAFYFCSSLTSITIPNAVTNININTFRYCKNLTSITLSENVASIGEGAFYDCSSLTYITIPNAVTNIGGDAFRYCENLTRITLSENVASIGESAFYDCKTLETVYYIGTEEEWNAISIASSNEPLTSANIIFLDSAADVSIVGATSTDDSLKFISRAKCNDEAPITSFGTTFIPLWLFDDTSAEPAVVEYDNSQYNIEYGQTFGATLTGIPESCKDMAIVAKSYFVRVNGDYVWSDAKTASVNNTSLTDVE